MPTFKILPYELDISREAALLDTNVLFAAFSQRDQKRQNAREFLFDVWENELLVPIPVLIETWGLLVGRNKDWESGMELLNWINSPGTAVTLLPQHANHSVLVRDIIARMRIDCVDATLIYLANEFTVQCSLAPPIRIVTYDTSDFLRCIPIYKLRASVLNPDTLETYP